jgi:hypothetical protein
MKYLPPESATVTAVRNGMDPDDLAEAAGADEAEHSPWSMTEMLLASMLDEQRVGNYMFAQVNSEKPVGKPPAPTSRPGVKKPRKTGMSAAQRMAFDPRVKDGG